MTMSLKSVLGVLGMSGTTVRPAARQQAAT
jgi:hypothetical protein